MDSSVLFRIIKQNHLLPMAIMSKHGHLYLNLPYVSDFRFYQERFWKKALFPRYSQISPQSIDLHKYPDVYTLQTTSLF